MAALSVIDKELESVLRPWLQKQKIISIQEITPVVIRHMAVHGDLYLVLDDYHLIDNEAVHEAVSHIFQYLPHLHLTILSRHSLPFPVSSLRMREQMVEITAGDLRLTADEAERFFTDIMSCNLSPQQVVEIFRQTEGWIGGLQLFGLAFQVNHMAHSDDQGRTYLINQWTTEYLVNEVINVQEERIKRFLLTTCLLDRFDVKLCAEITGFADAGEILDRIYRDNLFLVPLDHEGQWYRYHHLFSEAARRRGLVESIEDARAIHRKASLWFASKQFGRGCPSPCPGNGRSGVCRGRA